MDIKAEFNRVSRDYDRQRPKFIPCFYDFYNIAVDNLELENASPEILDLGAGTGLFSEFVLQKYPQAKITLVDISDKMLEMAKQRFSGNTNISLIHHDIDTFESNKMYDAIISSLAIHHLEDQRKVSLYKKIFTLLKDNALFIHAEQVEGETSYFKDLNHQQWVKSVENSGLSREEIDLGYERAKLDKRTALSIQLKWLKDIGFSEVDCLYKYYDFTVIYCKK